VSINYTPMGIAASSGAKYVLIPTDCGPAKLRHEEFHISNTTLSGKLAGQGITIPSKKDLEQLIQAVSEISHFGPALVAEHPGWCGKAFAQQDGTVIGPERDGVHVVFQPNAGRIRSRGTLAEWQEQVAGPVARQPIPAFAIMAAFLPAVLRFMPQVGNVTLELVGSADTGKSTIQKLAASVAYPPDGLNSCRDVQRDLHGLLDAGWDYPLFLDHAEPTLLTATKPKKAELYAAIAFEPPVLPADEPSAITRPQPSSRIPGSARRAQRNAPVRFTSIVFCHEASDVASSSSTMKMPAFRTSTSTGPSSLSTCEKPRSTAASSETSIATAVPPSKGTASRSAAATRAPCAASVSAIARPIPRPAPVTSATRPSSPLTRMPVNTSTGRR